MALSENRTPVRKCAHCSRIKCSHNRHEVILAGFGQVFRVPVAVQAQAFSRSELYSYALLLWSNPADNVATCLSVAGGLRSACCGGTSAEENAPNRHMWARACAHVHNPTWRWARHIINSCHRVPFLNPIASCDSQERWRKQRWRGAVFRNLDINTSAGHTLRVCVCVCVSRYLRA